MDVNALAALWSAARGPRPGARRLPPGRRFLLAGLLLPLGLYLGGASLWAGLHLGSRLPTVDAAAAGAILWRIPLLLGLAGALWDGGCSVNPTPCRPFFITLPTLVLAEGMLGLTTVPKRVLGALGLLFTLGLAWGRPRLLLLGLALTCLGILWTACLERVIHHLLPAGLLRQRAFLGVFLGLGAGLAGLSLLAGKPPSIPFLPALSRAWSWPCVQLLRCWQTSNPSRLLAPAGATLTLLALTSVCVRRELAVDRKPGTALGGGRLWSFRRPWLGVAKLQCHQILASRAGQMRLLMLLLSVVVAKEPELITMGTLQIPKVWTALAAGLALGPLLMVPLGNLLGFDRGGVRTWWAAPLRDRDLLLGKVLGCAAYAALAVPILLALLHQGRAWRFENLPHASGFPLRVAPSPLPMGAGETLAVGLLLGALFLWWAGSGLPRSLRGAAPLGLGSYAVSIEIDDEKVARVGMFLAPLAWMVPVYGAALLLGAPAAAAAMALLLLGAGARFRRRLGSACRELDQQREAVTFALAAGR